MENMTPMIMTCYKIFYFLFISCHVCYELYPFYQSEAASLPPTNTTASASQGKGGISSGTIVTIVVSISVAVVMLIAGICCFCKRIRNKYDSESAIGISNVDSLQYDFRTIEAATNKFSTKIGEGGFGKVYMGMLPNGQEIAVKRFSRSSNQSVQVFKNEVEVLAKIQHRNLVKLLGFCLLREEKILVYEYMSNSSLDRIIFDPERQKQLDWAKRYKIVKEIARGIQYIHDDSRLRIIHRDIKPSNILLDSDMNPKIADFGLALYFKVDQTQGNTDRIVGTYGYAAPEYVYHGDFSMKSDVYSFGILLMEIIIGKKIHSCNQMENGYEEPLMSYVWPRWENGEALELVDPTIRESCNPNEVMRCIHIALLCVQQDPTHRPSMSSVRLMLECYSLTLPTPSLLGFSSSIAPTEGTKEEDKLSTMSRESV